MVPHSGLLTSSFQLQIFSTPFDFPLAPALFGSVLCCSQVPKNVPKVFLRLISNFAPLRLLGMTWILLKIRRLVLGPGTRSSLVNIPQITWRNLGTVVGGRFYKCPLHSWPVRPLVSFYPHGFSPHVFHHRRAEDSKARATENVDVAVSLHFCSS